MTHFIQKIKVVLSFITFYFLALLKRNNHKVIVYRFLFIISVFTLSGCQQLSAVSNSTNQNHLSEPGALTLDLMTFNIRNGRAKDGENSWNNRKGLVFDVLNNQSADVIGLQEAFRFQLDEINEMVPKYIEVGEGRAGDEYDEYSAILYRKDKFILENSGTFWLSDSPTYPSKSWGNSHIRICTWVRLVDKKTERKFYVYNTHLDNRSQFSREESVRFILNVIDNRVDKIPYVLMGDFNAGEDNEAIKYLQNKNLKVDPFAIQTFMVDSYRVIHPKVKNVGTFNSFAGDESGPKIDYIFVDPSVNVLDADILKTNVSGRYPSDHFPVITKIKIE